MKIAVAMSGGVDSSMAAILLQEQGHEVIGITLKLLGDDFVGLDGRPITEGMVHDAASVAEKFDFQHRVIDLSEKFADEIITPFCMAYCAGRTPNPCVRCDAFIKFRALHDFALSDRCDAIASGHYARIKRNGEGRYYIAMNSDRSRDQSYFLYMLPQDILSILIFPLSEYTKSKLREEAESRDLPVARKADSQEICFIPDNNYPAFIEQKIKTPPPEGDIVNSEGRLLGTHRGIHRYTIGQRRGMGISDTRPLYVTAIDAPHNRIVAGYEKELYAGGLIAGDIHFMKETRLDGKMVSVKNRSTQVPVRALLEERGSTIHVSFAEPQSGISPGQSCVFYDDELGILGGGIIDRGIPIN